MLRRDLETYFVRVYGWDEEEEEEELPIWRCWREREPP